mmetsp:Transcript_12553/g.50468  ORF Transcript_12553/g.50468 Transcript_12553/m.50468 type:complete len:266 (-) Transcript_12553:796-1593(-)
MRRAGPRPRRAHLVPVHALTVRGGGPQELAVGCRRDARREQAVVPARSRPRGMRVKRGDLCAAPRSVYPNRPVPVREEQQSPAPSTGEGPAVDEPVTRGDAFEFELANGRTVLGVDERHPDGRVGRGVTRAVDHRSAARRDQLPAFCGGASSNIARPRQRRQTREPKAANRQTLRRPRARRRAVVTDRAGKTRPVAAPNAPRANLLRVQTRRVQDAPVAGRGDVRGDVVPVGRAVATPRIVPGVRSGGFGDTGSARLVRMIYSFE